MKKLIIGLTGPTGSGKSTLCETARETGFFVIDADRVAHEVTNTDACKQELKAAFGDILNADGSLCRKALAEKAFRDKESTARLNSITLPHIMKEIEVIISGGGDKIVLDAPTLFEAGANRLCFSVIGVLAPKAERLSRIISRDGIENSAAKLRISAGKPDEFYKNRCDVIIENSGSTELLQKNCRHALNSIMENFNNEA